MPTVTPTANTAEKTTLKRKLALLILSLVLLVVVGIYAATAWYTRMVQVADMTFTTAQWEFLANEAMDAISLNVYEYSTLQSNTENAQDPASPGTAGYIPVLLSAVEAETDVEYIVTIDKTSMSEEFQDRIIFYYYDSNGTSIEGGNDGTSTEGAISTASGFASHSANLVEFSDVNYIEGTIDISENTSKTVIIYLYWEWVYELYPADMAEYNDGEDNTEFIAVNSLFTDKNLTTTDFTESDLTEEEIATIEAKIQEIVTENNTFDTKVGKNPTLYETDMIATINSAGVEATPIADTD